MQAAPTRQPVWNPFGWRERLARLQGSTVQFDLRAYDQPLNIINSLESELLGLSSAQFAGRAREIRDQVLRGEPRKHLRPRFFALTREASRRALGMRPFDVQIVAALALDDGQIVEMQTGEGKTLAAVMPASLNALCDLLSGRVDAFACTLGVRRLVRSTTYTTRTEWGSRVRRSLALREQIIGPSVSDHMVPARPPVHVVAFVCALVLTCFGSSGFGQPRQTAARHLALVGGTIYVSPTEDPIPDGVVLIQDGKIDAVGRRASLPIPKGLRILDCSGLTITAGFWNSHVHFMERQWAGAADIPSAELSGQLQVMLTRYGVTSAFDTGSSWENTRRLRDRIESGGIPGPRIRSTGEILFPKGGAIKPETLDVIGSMRLQTPEIADGADALAAAKKLLDAGVDGIKLYAATWYPPFVALPEEAMRAASEEAHRRGKPVFAHPTNRMGLLAALRGGADILVHTTPESGAWDETILSAMKQRGVALIPTLKLWKYELRHDRPSTRERFAGTGIGQLRAWLASGGRILFGTDVGYMNDYDPSEEYALMAEAGMTFRQILASLTTAPAERFGASKQLGRIAPGFTADLVVLNRDPSKDVRGLGAVQYTIRDGVVIYQAGR